MWKSDIAGWLWSILNVLYNVIWVIITSICNWINLPSHIFNYTFSASSNIGSSNPFSVIQMIRDFPLYSPWLNVAKLMVFSIHQSHGTEYWRVNERIIQSEWINENHCEESGTIDKPLSQPKMNVCGLLFGDLLFFFTDKKYLTV